MKPKSITKLSLLDIRPGPFLLRQYELFAFTC
jgi:hypothetical protein